MSAAPEFAPEVFIPQQARQRSPVRLALVGYAVVPGTARVASQVLPAPLPIENGVLVGGAVAFSPAPASPAVAPRPAPAARPVRPAVRVVRPSRPAVAAPTSVRSAAPLRLTRRGACALALATVLLGVALLAVAHLSLASGATGVARTGSPIAAVTVQPGDTLWSIAAEVAPDRDPRQVVDQLQRLNRLTSASLIPGQTLKVS